MPDGQMNATANRQGITFLDAALLLFVGLKLTHQIDWSWWWVFAPMWMPFALAIVLGFLGILIKSAQGKT